MGMGLSLPKWCTKDTMEKLRDLLFLDYEVWSHTIKQKRLHGGQLIKRFLDNMNIFSNDSNTKKVYLFGGHDTTLMGSARALGIEFLIPEYGTAIILEKLRDQNNELYVKVSKLFFI